MAEAEARLRRYTLYDEVNAPYLAWQLEQFRPYVGRRVLEVGCGVGAIIAQLGDRELVMGVDIEPELLEYTRNRFASSPRHEFQALDISAVSESTLRVLKGKAFDTVICINVLEHIQDEGRAAATMADILAPSGALNILVPAHPALFGPYDRVDGHFRRYTKASLRKVLEAAGLRIERIYHFNALGALGWWYQYKLRRRDQQTKSDYRLMQRLLPAIKGVEARVKPPFGMSLIAIARKPSA